MWITAAALLAAALPAAAQYPGQIANPDKNAPTLRAVAVFEWTGDEARPKTSRLVPICIYDGQQLEDAGEYLARPAPIALESDVEYDLLKDGKPVGRFDVNTAEREQGAWMGYGKHLPMPAAKSAPAQVARIDEDDAQSDEPVLHRKHHAADSGSGASASSGPDPNAPPPDPDRPTLHRSSDASSSNSGDSSSNSSSGNPSSNDSAQPKLKKKKNEDDGSYVSDVATLTDPNRPHLFRGKSAGYDVAVTPTLRGLPPDMQQEVAVSDAADRPVHLWDYTWANPGDEAKMKAAMEDLARTALGLNPPTHSKTARKSDSTAHKPTQLTSPPEPAPLLDEKFHVFELAYGAGATMVLSARTDGTGEPEKFVTLIAQPDLYGNLTVLVKSVTDAAHLDDTPRMRLVDAVDALSDNRGELLFELRGATQRQFTLYRVLRGDARQIFLTDPEAIVVTAAN